MIFTDTHTHLYSESFSEDQHEVIERALQNNVSKFYVPAIDSTHTDAMYALEKNYPEHVKLMMGLHPTSVGENVEEELEHVFENFAKRDFIAVGEIGIDLYWDKSFLKEQKYAFKKQIHLAKEKNLPIVIHCRDAFDEIFEVLEEENHSSLRGIFHCFTGTKDQALKAIDYGMKLGLGGVLTFKNGKIDQFIDEIDLSNLVLETDSPYLAPSPFRGKRNESAYLIYVAKKISEIKKLSLEEIAATTTNNALQIFGE